MYIVSKIYYKIYLKNMSEDKPRNTKKEIKNGGNMSMKTYNDMHVMTEEELNSKEWEDVDSIPRNLISGRSEGEWHGDVCEFYVYSIKLGARDDEEVEVKGYDPKEEDEFNKLFNQE